MASGSFFGPKFALAAAFCVLASGAAVWQWQQYSRPRPSTKELREPRRAPPTAGASAGGMSADGKEGVGNAAAAPTGAAAAPAGEPAAGQPGAERRIVRPGGGGGHELTANNIEEAAEQLGTSPEVLRSRMEWMKTDDAAMPEAKLAYQKTKAAEEATSVRQLLISSIEKQAPALLSWSTAPTSEASALANASAAAILGRVRGDSEYRAAITGLGGDASKLPPIDPTKGAALREALDGATLDPVNIRLRKAPSENEGMPIPKNLPPNAMIVAAMAMGDGPEVTQMISSAGALFPATAEREEKKLHAIEVRVPLKFATVGVPDGKASLSVVMVRIKDGQWQPGQFMIYIADEAAARALTRRGN